MKKWESVLRRDSEAWESLKETLREIETRELNRLMLIEKDLIDRHRGMIDGIRKVMFEFTANEREEQSRARRN